MTAVERARSLADDLLRPAAAQVDRTRVPRSHLNALGAAGLLGMSGPPELGGLAREQAREVVELVSGACASTWFVMTQHLTPVAMLTASSNAGLKERLLAPMCRGEVLSGVAIAHLRRPGQPAVTASRTADGWVFDGHVGWMTSWGICDVFLLCGLTADRTEAVFTLVPAREAPGLVASDPMELLAMQATSTVTLDLSGYVVPDADVVDVQAYESWAEADHDRTADVTGAVFGVQREAVRQLADREPALAEMLTSESDRLRNRAYAPAGGPRRIDERLALRAAALDLCLRSATALVIAVGGSAMGRDHPAQRLLREAAFLQVQAQTTAVRAAMVGLLLSEK